MRDLKIKCRYLFVERTFLQQILFYLQIFHFFIMQVFSFDLLINIPMIKVFIYLLNSIPYNYSYYIAFVLHNQRKTNRFSTTLL